MHPVCRAVRHSLYVVGCSAVGLAATGLAGTALAAAPQGDALEEIVVTATKRSETLIETPAAISALSADKLGAGGVQNIQDLSSEVPGLSVGNQFGVNRTFIRGIGLTSIDLGADGAVAFLQNEALIARPAAQLTGFYDLERVEVLRGPQGTLYGRGATAGVVNLVTAKPTQEVSGYADVTGGNYSLKTFEGAISGGLTDSISARLAGKWEKHDGYGKNLVTGKPVDDRDAWAARLSVRYKPSETYTLDLVVDHFNEDDYNYAFHYFGPTVTTDQGLPARIFGGTTIFDHGGNIRDLWSREDAINQRHGTSGTVVVDWKPGNYELKSISAYRSFWRFNRDDLAVSDALLWGQNNYTEESKSWSQEFTLTFSGAGIDWLTGAMYFHEKNPGEVKVPLVNIAALLVASPPGNCTPLTPGAPIPCGLLDSFNYRQAGEVTTDAYAFYVEGAKNLSEQLKLTIGGRFNDEKRKGTGSFVFGPAVNIPTDQEKSWTAGTWRALLEYKTGTGSLLYASATRGFKSGVINIGSGDPPINPETVTAGEIGWKTKIGGWANFSAAAFYYSYKDLQVGFVNDKSTVQTINAADARNYGLELEGQAKFNDMFSGDAAVTFLSAKYTKFDNYYYRNGFQKLSLKGNYLQNAPQSTAHLGVNLEVPLAASGGLTFRAEAAYSSKVYFTEWNNDDAVQDAYTLINASAAWHSANDRFSVTAWIRNAGDKLVKANNIITAPLYASIRVGTLVPPRTFGLTAGVKF
jgi:iron complex outermembrane receptor protein